MHPRHLIKVAAAFVILTIAFSGLAYGENNPGKIGWSSSSDFGASGEQEFVCGTYKGNEAEIRWFASLYESAKQKASLVQAADFIFDDVWVVEDDGTILFSGLNIFDTDFATFHFEPNGSISCNPR